MLWHSNTSNELNITIIQKFPSTQTRQKSLTVMSRREGCALHSDGRWPKPLLLACSATCPRPVSHLLNIRWYTERIPAHGTSLPQPDEFFFSSSGLFSQCIQSWAQVSLPQWWPYLTTRSKTVPIPATLERLTLLRCRAFLTAWNYLPLAHCFIIHRGSDFIIFTAVSFSAYSVPGPQQYLIPEVNGLRVPIHKTL